MKLTIVIAYYNLRFFEETLKSLSMQTNHDFIVLICNDASPENPEALIQYYSDKLNINYRYFDDNLGGQNLCYHWIRCLELVQTDWFMILGDDDQLSKDAVQAFYDELFSSSDANVFRFDIQHVNEFSEKIADKIKHVNLETSTKFAVQKAQGLFLASSLGEYIFSTDAYKEVNIRCYPRAFYSDNMLVLEVSAFSLIKNISRGEAIIRVSEFSFSGNSKYFDEFEKAQYFYYFDLLTLHAVKFNQQDLKYFLPPVIKGYLKGHLKISISDFCKILYRSGGVFYSLKFFFLNYRSKFIKQKQKSIWSL